MPILNANHLFDQGEKLVVTPAGGVPRQVDLRRAISAAYYGLFHFCLTAVADEFVGVSQRQTSRYALVYRSVDHRTLKDLCVEAKKQTLPAKYRPYLPPDGFGADLQAFSMSAIDLQEKRHLADYNPQPRFTKSDARFAVNAARTAVGRLTACDGEQRKAFLTLLLCPPR